MKVKKYLQLAIVLTSFLIATFLTACTQEQNLDDNLEYNDADYNILSDLEPIDYVGAAHATQKIINALPLPGSNWTVHSIQIGADHGFFGYGDYTLTVFYEVETDTIELAAEELPETEFAANAARLFSMVHNLQAVTFSVNSGAEAELDDYLYRWSITRTNSDARGNAIISYKEASTDAEAYYGIGIHRLFNSFTISEVVSEELRAGFLMVYYANAPATLAAIEDVSADIFRVQQLPDNFEELLPQEFPNWEEREVIKPLYIGDIAEWLAEEYNLMPGPTSTFLLEAGIYVVMVRRGMDDHFIVIVGEDNF